MRIGITLIFFLIFFKGLHVQDIEVILFVDPNPSPFISDWSNDPSIANLTIQSNDPEPLELSLSGEIIENSLGGIAQAQSIPFVINPGEFIQMNCEEFLFNESISYNPDIEEQIIATGRIPEGDYQLCIQLFLEPNHEMIQTVCQPFFIQQIDPVSLIYPVNETVQFQEFTTFQWQPANTTEPIQYAFTLASVLENQTPEEAVLLNASLVNDFTQDSHFPIDWTLLDIDGSLESQTLAWQVQTLDFNNNPIGDNNGLSAVESFELTNLIASETSIVITNPNTTCSGSVGPGHSEAVINIEFEVTGEFEALYLVVNTNDCGRYTPTPTPTPTTTPTPTPTTTTSGGMVSVPIEVLDDINQWYVEPYEVFYGEPVEVISHPQQGSSAVYSHQVPIGEFANEGDAYTVFVAGTPTGNPQNTTVSQPACDRYSPESPITGDTVEPTPCPPPEPSPRYCNIKPEENVAPAMDGGLHKNFTGKRTINRDDFVALGAEGKDYDTFIYDCLPGDQCPEKGSNETLGLSGRVKFEWEIKSGGGSFKKIGCLPANVKNEVGEYVIFQPPAVVWPTKAQKHIDSLTTIILKIVDDNPTQPKDKTVEREIKIKTRRYYDVKKADIYEVTVESSKYKLPTPPKPKKLQQDCKASKKWEQKKDLPKPDYKTPDVTDGDKMVVGQWMRLEAIDIRDPDKLITLCDSELCTDSGYEKVFQDNVEWKWIIKTRDGGRFIKSKSATKYTTIVGRYVIYEAPFELKQPYKDIEFELEVTDNLAEKKSIQLVDVKPENKKFKIRVYRAGIKLEQTPKDWLPEFENSVELESKLMYEESKDKWKDGFAHMCRIHFFELDDISKEKGYCNNAPEKDLANSCPDLRFINKDNLEAYQLKKLKVTKSCTRINSYFKNARTYPSKLDYKVNVHSEDYASFAKLISWANKNRSEAWKKEHGPKYISIPLTRDEKKHPKSHPVAAMYKDNRVTIPKDVDENHIADSGWKVSKTAKKKDPIPDTRNPLDDNENKPLGDGFKGDGYSYYEEYRGFKTSKPTTQHVRTHTGIKNLFILNDADLDWGLFESAFKYKIYEVEDDQVDLEYRTKIKGTRLGICWMNFNHGLNHIQLQAGIKLFDGKGSKLGTEGLLGKAITANGNKSPYGPPNIVWGAMVNVKKVNKVSKRNKLDAKKKMKTVVAHELGHCLNVHHHGEGGGVNGFRSGNLNCLMRYDNYKKKKEDIGTTLCNNGNKNNPVDLNFGNCARGRGDCDHQHRVNGKPPAPPAR